MGKALNLGTTRPFPELSKYQRRASRWRTGPPPARGRRQGGRERGRLGPRDGTPYQAANRPPVSNQRLPEILDGQHPPGGSQLESSSPELTQGAPDRHARKLRLGPRRGEGAPHPRRVSSSRSWLPELLLPGRHKTQAQPSLRLCGVPEHLNLSGLGLGSPRRAGPAPWSAAWSLSSVDGESTHTRERGKPSVAGTPRVLPTQASDTGLQGPPFPQHD